MLLPERAPSTLLRRVPSGLVLHSLRVTGTHLSFHRSLSSPTAIISSSTLEHSHRHRHGCGHQPEPSHRYRTGKARGRVRSPGGDRLGY